MEVLENSGDFDVLKGNMSFWDISNPAGSYGLSRFEKSDPLAYPPLFCDTLFNKINVAQCGLAPPMGKRDAFVWLGKPSSYPNTKQAMCFVSFGFSRDTMNVQAVRRPMPSTGGK